MRLERRKFRRVPTTAVTQWKKYTANPEYTPSFPAITKNISLGGVCISTYSKLNLGDTLRVEISLPSKKTIKFLGKVVWLKDAEHNKSERVQYDVGLQIADMSAEDQEEISKFAFLNFFLTSET